MTRDDRTPSWHVFTSELIVCVGAFHEVGRPILILSVRAARLPLPSSNVLLVRSDSRGAQAEVHEMEASFDKLDELVRVLENAGFPGRELALEGIVDTGDLWKSIDLHVTLNDRTGSVRLSLAQSGYRGADAASFASILTHLLDITGLSPADPSRWLANAALS